MTWNRCTRVSTDLSKWVLNTCDFRAIKHNFSFNTPYRCTELQQLAEVKAKKWFVWKKPHRGNGQKCFSPDFFTCDTHTHMHSCNKWIEYPATAWDNSLCRIKIFSKHHRYDGAQTTCLRNGKPIFHFNPSYSSISNKRVRRQRKMMQMFLYRRIVLLEMPVALCWNGLRRTPRKGSKRTLQESRTHTHTPRTLALIETLQRGGSKKWKLGLVLSDLARQAGLQGKRTGLDPAMWCLVGAIIAAVCP